MAAVLLPDALWELIEPLLPLPPSRPNGARPRVPDRACLTGMLFVLHSGIPWQMLPRELGCGSGMSDKRAPPFLGSFLAQPFASGHITGK